ncbi:ATP-binding protein [Endozoicomonas sp. G2_1]|uniref:ATP-binding protein n=1 Tax=Endozoicomonas sp. G2_1 TaxID=2821091 RepID=UPI001ADA845E|nr:ATP-binding protein [Endozoicomonas sp. G2_1]MBO9489851.1 ATP-binding protein [Endozoicomonas sp. G2_1]
MKSNYKLAEYKEVILPEHQGNPLLEALPNKISVQEIIKQLSYFPDYSEEISEAKDEVRLEYLSRLELFRQPLKEYVASFRMIEKGIKRSLSSKNPLSAATNYKQFYSKIDTEKKYSAKYPFNSDGIGMSLIGPSGVGKSKMLEQIYNFYDPVIQHRSYNSNKLNILQVPILFVECPSNGTPKGLCIAIINSFHKVLQLPLRNIARKTLDELIIEVAGYVETYFLGVLIIDELQKLSESKVGAIAIQDFLLSLINECGVSVLFCGNNELENILTTTFRNARRAEAGGVVYMLPMVYVDNFEDDSLSDEQKEKGAAWEAFTDALWDYQWTRTYTELDCSLKFKLYELTKGNVDLAVRTFQKAQEILINSASIDERITEAVLESAFNEISKLTRSTLDVTLLSIAKPARRKSKQKAVKTTSSQPKNIVIPGDLSRPQHSEFASKIDEVLHDGYTFDRIKSKNKIRKAMDSDDAIQYFKDSNMWAEY